MVEQEDRVIAGVQIGSRIDRFGRDVGFEEGRHLASNDMTVDP
jgi:hypothetical protein